MIKFYSFLIGAFLLVSVNANAQKTYPAILEFFNGEVKKGLIEMPAPDSKKIKYRATPDDKQIKIAVEEVSAITIKRDDAVFEIENIAVDGTNYSLLLAKLVEGKVNVYAYERSGQLAGIVIYHVKRANEKKATRFRSLKYKEDMSKYFADDPELIKHIREISAFELDREFVNIVRAHNAR